MDRLYGLIGKNISYSFSRSYFSEKFEKEKLYGQSYVNFDIPNIDHFKEVILQNPNLGGLNVTIPYKEEIIPYLDDLSKEAIAIGAVNTIKFDHGKLIGHNTDYFGFQSSVTPLLKASHKQALILGTGGASKAIAYVFKKLAIDYQFVSRKPTADFLSYDQLNKEVMEEFTIIVNCTPLGTFPQIDLKPPIPYKMLSKKHLLYDLIYNPKETLFLKLGKEKGASTINGLSMLELQAEKAWEIWNS